MPRYFTFCTVWFTLVSKFFPLYRRLYILRKRDRSKSRSARVSEDVSKTLSFSISLNSSLIRLKLKLKTIFNNQLNAKEWSSDVNTWEYKVVFMRWIFSFFIAWTLVVNKWNYNSDCTKILSRFKTKIESRSIYKGNVSLQFGPVS